MRLVRFGPPGHEKPGLLDAEGGIRDLSDVVDDITGEVLSDTGLDRLRALDPASLPRVAEGTRLGPPVGHVSKIVCIGLNYADHAAESGATVPPDPLVFFKATSAICGPNDPLIIPKGSTKTDWEVELGVVIGKRALHVTEDDWESVVAGYLVIDDVSERDFQKQPVGEWEKGKSADSFAPLGPWLVTRDAVADPHDLAMFTEIDGVRRQDGSTTTMVHRIPAILAHVTRFFTLLPGDVIATGTPPGVGMGMTPPTYLAPGQEVRMGVEGLGEQRQTTVAWSPEA